jgi:hypothetical protein
MNQEGSNMNFSKIIIFISMFALQNIEAQNLKVGHPNFGGNGCPVDSVNLTVSPDDTAVSVLFDQMIVESGGNTNRRSEQKTCKLSIPIEVPKGFKATVAKVDYRGYVFASKQNIFNNLSVDYIWFAHPGRHYESKFKGPIDDVFALSQNIQAHLKQWTACGQASQLVITADILTRTNPQGDTSILALDSIDGTSQDTGLKFHLEYLPCP